MNAVVSAWVRYSAHVHEYPKCKSNVVCQIWVDGMYELAKDNINLNSACTQAKNTKSMYDIRP